MQQSREEGGSAQGLDLRRSLKRGAWSLALTFAVLVLLSLAVWQLDPKAQALGDIVRRSHPLLLLTSVCLISLAPLAMALRWRALLPGRGQPILPMTGYLCVGILFNYALPGPVGELASATLVSKRYQISLADSLATLAVGRLLGLGLAAALAGSLYLLAPVGVTPQVRQLAFGASVLLLLAATALGSAALWPDLPRRLLLPLLAPLGRAPGRLGRLGDRGAAAVEELASALARTARRGWWAYLQASGWALGGHLAVASGIALAAMAMGMDPPWSGVVFTYAASTAGALVLFLFPGSHVGWDLSFGTVLALTTGLSPTEAAAVTVVVRLQHSLVVIAGVAALYLSGRRLLPDQLETRSSD